MNTTFLFGDSSNPTDALSLRQSDRHICLHLMKSITKSTLAWLIFNRN